jgi:uncharacterized OB-fold protein
MNTNTRPLPSPTAWSAAFWDAAREQRLIYQACGECGTATMYPKRVCPECLADAQIWRDASGHGEVYTYTEQVAGPPSGFEDLVPYVVAVIRLDEGVQLMSNIVGPDAATARCGDRVTVAFHTVAGTDTVLPVFTLDRSAGA